jgi:para-aminobenzoate synthetase/4-amino-4-deoxychorismate lyase
MRIDVEPAGAATFATQAVDPLDFFPTPERGAELRSVRCPGGLGRHKWADRRPLGETPAGPVSLLLDHGDEVLEAGRANVFAAHEWALHTPPDDGRILPGVARARTIEAARATGVEVAERALSRADLLAADGVFLTGSVRGVEPIRCLDGQPLPGIGEVGNRVAARLQRSWRTAQPLAAGVTSPRPARA